MQQVSNTVVNQQVCIAMAGVAKVFVGELVEEALKVAEQRNNQGPLLPSHIREARVSEHSWFNKAKFQSKYSIQSE